MVTRVNYLNPGVGSQLHALRKRVTTCLDGDLKLEAHLVSPPRASRISSTGESMPSAFAMRRSSVTLNEVKPASLRCRVVYGIPETSDTDRMVSSRSRMVARIEVATASEIA